MTVYLTFEQLVVIHEAATGASGIRDAGAIEAATGTLTGASGIRDAGAIQSAVGRPQASAFGQDAYETIWEKAAALLQSLACNHGWVDGNKRTAWVATLTFLTVNGHPLDPGFDQQAAEDFMVAVAEGRYPAVADIAGELVKFSR